MTRVVVVGATGRTGHLVVGALLRRGHEVTGAARHPRSLLGAELGDTGPADLRAVRADVRDPVSLRKAVAGHDAIISVIGTPARHPERLYSQGTTNLLLAAEDEGIRRLVCTSSGGVRRDDTGLPFWYRRIVVPLLLSDLYADMARMEDAVRGSDLDWTIVRPASLTDDPATGDYRLEDGRNPSGGWKLPRADLAEFLAEQVDSDEWLRRAPTLAC